MEYEVEISAEVDTDYDTLIKLLESKGFELKEVYDLNDIYLIHKNDIEDDYYNVLNKCIILRHMIEEGNDVKAVVHKYKEYNDKKEIIKQGKIDFKFNDDIERARELFEMSGFIELIRINDHIVVYATKDEELIVQNVNNNKHIYIEIENNRYYIEKEYNTIDDLKSIIINNNIPIKNNDFFVKKAIIEMSEKYDKPLTLALKNQDR